MVEEGDEGVAEVGELEEEEEEDKEVEDKEGEDKEVEDKEVEDKEVVASIILLYPSGCVFTSISRVCNRQG